MKKHSLYTIEWIDIVASAEWIDSKEVDNWITKQNIVKSVGYFIGETKEYYAFTSGILENDYTDIVIYPKGVIKNTKEIRETNRDKLLDKLDKLAWS